MTSFMTYLFCLHLLKWKWKWFGLILWSQIKVQRYFMFCVLIRSQAECLVSNVKFETGHSERWSDRLYDNTTTKGPDAPRRVSRRDHPTTRGRRKPCRCVLDRGTTEPGPAWAAACPRHRPTETASSTPSTLSSSANPLRHFSLHGTNQHNRQNTHARLTSLHSLTGTITKQKI